MGARLSSIQSARPRAPSRTGQPHRYDPDSDEPYFASQYYLGHRRFDTGDPELFLFGELADLNYLPPKAVAFPYKQPPKNRPGRCLRSYINLQRDTIKVKKCAGSEETYSVQFMFDSDVDCQFTLYNHLPDSVDMETLIKSSYEGEGVVASQQYQYSAGSGEKFSEPSYTVTPGDFPEDKRGYNPSEGRNTFPFAVLMETTSTEEANYQAQLSICSLDKINNNGYSVKVTKQKLWVEGVEYLLQEVYGIENKLRGGGEGGEGSEDELDGDEVDLGAECVVCLTDPRDTLLLPCRHLCLCSGCAGNLRYQSSNCPICRAPFRALLQIQALEPLEPDDEVDDDSATGDPKYSIPGFRVVPLLQALNGYPISTEDDSDDDPGLVEPEEPVCPGSPSSEIQQQQQQRTTEFCAIPEEELSEAAAATGGVAQEGEGGGGTEEKLQEQKTLPTVKRSQYEIAEEDIPLPGTPTSDSDSLRIKLSVGSGGKLLETSLSLEPGSPCSSSVSSEQSAKSNDLLLPDSKAERERAQ